jgi:hypothetical protein
VIDKLRREAQIRALYARLPKMDCKGLCSACCGPIEMSLVERERLERAAGRPCTTDGRLTCSLLTVAGRCSAYDERPMICRLWGLVETMPCPHGCRPEGGLLSAEDGFRLLGLTMEVGGQPEDFAGLTLDLVELALADPVMSVAMNRLARGQRL